MRRRGFFKVVLGAITAPALANLPLPAPAAVPVPSAALSIPFKTLPINTYIRGPRYRIKFAKVNPAAGSTPTFLDP